MVKRKNYAFLFFSVLPFVGGWRGSLKGARKMFLGHALSSPPLSCNFLHTILNHHHPYSNCTLKSLFYFFLPWIFSEFWSHVPIWSSFEVFSSSLIRFCWILVWEFPCYLKYVFQFVSLRAYYWLTVLNGKVVRLLYCFLTVWNWVSFCDFIVFCAVFWFLLEFVSELTNHRGLGTFGFLRIRLGLFMTKWNLSWMIEMRS